MFWAKEEEQSSLVQLLKSDDVTLEAVLLNEFVVQDSRYGRPELVVYITEKENMVALLNLSLNPTINPNLPTKQQYRLSFIASEILTIRGTDVFQEKILTTDETRKVLTDFLSDDTPMTHLVAGFFAKIMECLLSRKLTLTFELLRETAFFDKCLQNINLGAVECLLENLVRIPNDSNGTTTVKNWMINDNLFEKLVNQISESNCDDKNECLSEVYCEILRELRDKLYMVDNKEDELHDKAMEEPLIAKLADNLVVDENCSSEDLVKKSSMISSSAKVLVALINTNFVAGAPAHHLEEVERNLIEERHFTYGLMKPCVDNDNYEQSYQPDPERMVEGIVANRLPNIFGTILKSIQANGSVWQPLLRLVIEVCNTNHLPTHEKLADALQKLPFIKLIEAAKKHPRATVMHSLLVKVVALILHSKFPHSEETLSPAAEYLLTGSDLIKNIYDSACSFHPPTDLISSCGLRAFNQNLGDVLLRAKKSSIAPPKMATLFKNDERWAELEDIILNYNGKHRPLLQRDYNNDSSMMSSLRNDSHGFNDSEEWTDASAKFAELDASSSNNRNFGSLGFEANLHRFSELDGQFDVTPDEDEFKKLCSERANSSSCSGTRSASDSYTWPGEEEKKGNTSTKPTPSKDEIWADFSSFVSGVDTPATNTSNPTEFSWPGAPTAEQGENTDWPLNSSHDSKPTDPATVGLAASISDDNSSEA